MHADSPDGSTGAPGPPVPSKAPHTAASSSAQKGLNPGEAQPPPRCGARRPLRNPSGGSPLPAPVPTTPHPTAASPEPGRAPCLPPAPVRAPARSNRHHGTRSALSSPPRRGPAARRTPVRARSPAPVRRTPPAPPTFPPPNPHGLRPAGPVRERADRRSLSSSHTHTLRADPTATPAAAAAARAWGTGAKRPTAASAAAAPPPQLPDGGVRVTPAGWREEGRGGEPRCRGAPAAARRRRLLTTYLGFVEPLAEPVHHHRGRCHPAAAACRCHRGCRLPARTARGTGASPAGRLRRVVAAAAAAAPPAATAPQGRGRRCGARAALSAGTGRRQRGLRAALTAPKTSRGRQRRRAPPLHCCPAGACAGAGPRSPASPAAATNRIAAGGGGYSPPSFMADSPRPLGLSFA